MSKKFTVRGAVDEALPVDVDFTYSKWYVAATYYSDTYATEVTPTAGTLTVSGKLPGAGAYSDFDDSTIDCTDPSEYCATEAPLESVLIAPGSIADAAYYKVVVTGVE